MNRWEYKICRFSSSNSYVQQQLNSLGKEGWELIFCIEDTFFFKREIFISEQDYNKSN